MALRRALVVTLALMATPVLAQPKTTVLEVPKAEAPKPEAKVDDWPAGAPRGDYEFTAWCFGALKQHMELFASVKPELDAISKRWKTEADDQKSYADQQAAGRDELALFTRALQEAEKASPRPINVQGAAAIDQGRKVFAQFNTVEPTWRAYSWMNWELPERCEPTARTLESKSKLLGQALKANSPTPPKPAPSAIGDKATSADPAKAILPAPRVEPQKLAVEDLIAAAKTSAKEPEKPAPKPPAADPPKLKYRN
jgi:hypothetical protein